MVLLGTWHLASTFLLLATPIAPNALYVLLHFSHVSNINNKGQHHRLLTLCIFSSILIIVQLQLKYYQPLLVFLFLSSVSRTGIIYSCQLCVRLKNSFSVAASSGCGY
ncbi:hypothetical protein U1Q18_016754 [Sarracenia purpurea var. burkii]